MRGSHTQLARWILVAASQFAAVGGLQTPPAVADEQPLRSRIDSLVAAAPDFAAQAAPLSSDSEFLRRVSLDLVGFPPTSAEARAFLDDPNPRKREILVDDLLARPEYARHMQQVFDVMLMRRLPANNVKDEEWTTFLRTSFAQNKPYDQLVREILSADGVDPNPRGPARFLLDRDADVHQITRDVGRLFLGADLGCAQCHNHPLVTGYKQADYYGLAAFLVRTSLFQDKDKKVAMLAEKADGEVSFESVFEVRDKVSTGPKSTPPQIFGALTVADPAIPKDDAYTVKPADNVRPVPKYSRRANLAAAITSPADRRFARTAANRLWSVVMGRGIVHPVDMDHPDNPPSHPELLDLLTDQFVAHKFDVQWLLRELVLSQTYQRSSLRLTPEGQPAPPAEEKQFAQASLRPLSPAQFARTVLQATGESEVQRAALGDALTEEAVHAKLAGYENQFVSLFGGAPGRPPEAFESTVTQVLFLSNDATIQGLVQRKDGNLADRLLKLPETDIAAIADDLYLSVLCRRPDPADVDDVTSYLQGQTGESRTAAMYELIWSLIASAEFRFNH